MAWGKGPPSTIEDFVRRLARDDPALESLAILRFRRCDPGDARALAAALATNTRLRFLVAAQHRLPPSAYRAIALALAENARSGVRSLSLGDGAFGDEGAEALVGGLLGRREPARAGGAGAEGKGEEEEEEAAGPAAASAAASTAAPPNNSSIINASLRHLDLEGRGLGQRAATALSELLRHHRALEHLELGGNEGLGDAGARALAAAASALSPPPAPSLPPPVAAAAPLRRLSLQRCGLTHEGVRALASAPFCQTLAELSLAENGGLRGAEGGAALAGLARASPRLRRLDLRQTALADAGVAAAVEGGLLAALVLAAAAVGESEEEEAAAAAPRASAAASPAAVLDLTSTGLAAGGGCEALAAALLALAAASSSTSGRRHPPARLALRLGHNRDVPAEAVARLAAALAGEGDNKNGKEEEEEEEEEEEGEGEGAADTATAPTAAPLAVVVEELDVGGASLDAVAVRALALVPGLRHLSLFSCASLGGGAETTTTTSEAVQALCEALSSTSSAPAPASFSSLEHLGLAACGLGAQALAALLESVTGGAEGSATTLRCLELGGNPGVQDDAFEAAVNRARERRPSLDVAWRAGADGGGGGGG
jgi:hypothetical protein